MKKVIFLMGPTASGKTDIAVSAAQQFPVDIISVDSALIYRHMNIGTAKPDADLLAKAPHALIDLIEPEQAFSVASFCKLALEEISKSHQAGRIPLLVGGTMMYFNALQYGLSELPEADTEIRERLAQQAAEQGWEAMHQRLQEIDPVSAKRIHPNDPQRIQRAIEVYEISGHSMTDLIAGQPRHEFLFDTLKLVAAWRDRADLHKRIAQRFDIMLDQGFVKEVEQLRERPELSKNHPSMRSVGYRQVWEYLDGETNQDQMREKGIIATRQLAKRQYTWLRKQQDANWFYMDDFGISEQILSNIREFVGQAQENFD